MTVAKPGASDSGLRRSLLRLSLTRNHRRLHRQWCDERLTSNGIVFQSHFFQPTSTSAFSIKMIEFESGDTVLKGC
ncbi:hypothetical protein TNCV_4518441 [Trichonephila clavipes]|nr:hypothetical protein TNCV_4518441 [Trichonephila clavipes]